jgi:hypothetical protein
MRLDDVKINICQAAGVTCPEWLKRKRDGNWLKECLRLVNAGVVVITPTGPDFCRHAQAGELVRYAHDIASLLSE